ncbi:hypothetical protein [Paenibacillus agricola]|uniref:Uncharacterized protein n=1 Tax=Paenibacillus agricola TaxID=2716264 RepID=A0ABX0J6P7_9BACL|nr:hypothetical protein [Paenibacillus agricola]NHN31817.1 hypothetical protein [Paenibacillus agricola]
MLVATHMLAASAIFQLSSVRAISGTKKAVALPIVFIGCLYSHFALDAVPHYELQMLANIGIGSIVIAFLFHIAWHTKDMFILAAACFGALPDVMWVLKISPEFDTIHSFLHSAMRNVPAYALGFELLGLLLLFYINYLCKSRI